MDKKDTVATISKDAALKLCIEIRQDSRGKWFSFGAAQCWGCEKFSQGDPAKMCFSSRTDNRGCSQVNARYDRRSWHAGT